MSFKNKNFPSWKDVLNTIKPIAILIAIAALIVAIIGIVATMTTEEISPVAVTVSASAEDAREKLWLEPTTKKILYTDGGYPGMRNINFNPLFMGVKIEKIENEMKIINGDKYFIAINYISVEKNTEIATKIVAPWKTVKIPLSREISASFPNPRIFRDGSNIFYACMALGHYIK